MDDRFKALVIGLGNIGLLYDLEKGRAHPSTHVCAYQDNADLVLVGGVDFDTQKASVLQQIAPEGRFYRSIPDALRDWPDVDCVSICTPPAFHQQNIAEVLQYSSPKIIFCEKPLASSLTDCQAIQELARQYPACQIVPNISRRWNRRLRALTRIITDKEYGELEKIHVCYTRGIYNTGAHLFDLLKMWTGTNIREVQVLQRVHTSSDREGEPSFTFYFVNDNRVYGLAEAINDEQYYIFDIDLYFTEGKISVKYSGDEIFFYRTAPHHLFAGFQELHLVQHMTDVLQDASMANAVENLVQVMRGKERPFCCLADAIYPLHVAQALERSYRTGCVERVDFDE